MLTPEYLAALPEALVRLWQQAEDDILRDIGRRLKPLAEGEAPTATAAWQLWRLEQARALRQDVTRLLAKYSGKSDAEIRRILQAAGTEALAADDAFYAAGGLAPGDVNDSPALRNLLNAGYRQTRGTWKNLTATTANTVSRQFEDALDRAWLQVSSGAFDCNTAVRRAVKGLAEGGLKAVSYPTGHTDTLEVAVRRAVLTGVNQTAAKLQLARMEEFGWEFVEVTAHAGARPEHALWQGRRFHRGGAVVYHGTAYEDFETATGYGTGPGLCGWNCRHSFYPCDPDTPPAYTDGALEALNAREVEYNGRLYTRYEISQMQRALERKVRAAKRQYLTESAAGLDTAGSAARLKQARQALNRFARGTGGRLDGARTAVQGFGRSEAGKAGWAARRNAPGGYSDLHLENRPVTMASISNVRAFACRTLDAAGSRSLQNAHKRLLVEAAKQPLGVEVGRIYGLDMKPLTGELTGSASGGRIRLPDQNSPYIAIHTHPDCNTFSPGDLRAFTYRSNLKLLTALGHDGHVYAIEKTEAFESEIAQALAKNLYSEISNLGGSDKEFLERANRLIRKCIEEMSRYGIEYYER